MRAIKVRQNGGPEVLGLQTLAEPVPGKNELLVRVMYAGVNFIDIYHRTGLYPRPTPFVPGIEGVGEILDLGPGVTEFSIGQLVVWKAAQASYAERTVISAAEAVSVPPGIEPKVAAASFVQGLTAHFLATSAYAIHPGDKVLVHAAAGGVGVILTQIAKLLGATVFATTSSPTKARIARNAGADEVYSYEDFREKVMKATNGTGVAAVYDGIGQATFDAGLSVLQPRGIMLLYGAVSGLARPLDLQRLNAGGSLYVTRPTLMDYTREPSELTKRSKDLFEWIMNDDVRVNIGGCYPLEEASSAHADLESRKHSGKFLLQVTPDR